MCPRPEASKKPTLAVTQEPQLPMKLRKLSTPVPGNRRCWNQATAQGTPLQKDGGCFLLYTLLLSANSWLLFPPGTPQNYSLLLIVKCGHLTYLSQSIYLEVRGPSVVALLNQKYYQGQIHQLVSCSHDHSEQRSLPKPSRFNVSMWFKPLGIRGLLVITA